MLAEHKVGRLTIKKRGIEEDAEILDYLEGWTVPTKPPTPDDPGNLGPLPGEEDSHGLTGAGHAAAAAAGPGDDRHLAV